MGMKYEPIKNFLNKIFATPFLRKIFYRLIDTLLLRTWHIHKEIKRWLKTAPDNPKVLDAGSGLGQHSYFVARKCRTCKITGVDVIEEQVAKSNEFFQKIGWGDRVKFLVGRLEEYVCPQCYDLVLNIEVIEHIEDDRQVLENFYASLRPGGTLILSTPSLYAEAHDHDHDDNEHTQGSFVDEHVRDGYDPAELEKMIKDIGFSEVKVKFMYGHFGGLAWKMTMKLPIIMLNKSFAFFIILPFYYLITMPFALVLNWLDTIVDNKKGGSLLVIAKK